MGSDASLAISIVRSNDGLIRHLSIESYHSAAFRPAVWQPELEPKLEQVITPENLSSREADNLPLPPIDGGWRAWLFLSAAILVEGILWGFPLCYGVFQNFYQSHPPFKGSNLIPVVGTLCTGISYVLPPVITPVITKYPAYQRHLICAGWIICVLALITSSFATHLWHLMLTQGLLYGAGYILMFYPTLSMMNEWFVKRRGLAIGLLLAGAGVCGLGLPFLVERLLERYGYAWTLRAYAIGIGSLSFVLVGPALPLLRSRLPLKKNTEKIDTSVFRTAGFFAMSFSNVFQGLVFFLPFIFMNSYAEAIGLSKSRGTALLSLMNVTQILGQVFMGYISDRVNVYIPLFCSCLGSAIIVAFGWGFSNSYIALIVFSLLYGSFAGGYNTLFSRFVTSLTHDVATGIWIYSMFELQRGLGNIVGGLATAPLVRGTVKESYGVGRYRNLIITIAACLFFSSFGGLGWVFTHPTRRKKEDVVIAGEYNQAQTAVDPGFQENCETHDDENIDPQAIGIAL